MGEVTLSAKNQIVVPRDTRKALGLKAGDKILVVPRGGHAVILRRPKSFAKAIRGLLKGVYPADYLEKEKDHWD
jgi:AbrB family looped-hinge helix DNA binding protein